MNTIIISVVLWVMRFSLFFPLLISTLKASAKENRGKIPRPLRIMQIHIVLAFLLQGCITTLELLHMEYTPFYHLYIVEEFILDMLFYQDILKAIPHGKDKPQKHPMFLIAIAAFVVFAIINALFITDIYHFPVYTFVIQSIVMIACTGGYYYYRAFYDTECISTYEAPAYRLYKGPVFWMNMGKLIYFIFALPLFILYHVAVEAGQKDMSMLIWSVQNISLIALHIFMGIGFLVFTSDRKKVLDVQGRYEKRQNNIHRKQYKQKDLGYMDFLKSFPEYFERFKKRNPDLVADNYTFEAFKKDVNALQRSQYIAQTPEMIAFLKNTLGALKNFKQENPDLFNEADKA
jgi:hypothetical protein